MAQLSLSRLSLLAAGLLIVVSAVRWHEAVASAPDRVEGVDGPAAVLVVQPGDCPERRAAMMRWLAAFQRRNDAGTRIHLAVAVLEEGPGALDDRLTALPRVGPSDTRSVARAVLRSGAPGTPALVLVGADGTVLAADTFAPGGVGARLLDAADLLGRLSVSSSRPGARVYGRRVPA